MALEHTGPDHLRVLPARQAGHHLRGGHHKQLRCLVDRRQELELEAPVEAKEPELEAPVEAQESQERE